MTAPTATADIVIAITAAAIVAQVTQRGRVELELDNHVILNECNQNLQLDRDIGLREKIVMIHLIRYSRSGMPNTIFVMYLLFLTSEVIASTASSFCLRNPIFFIFIQGGETGQYFRSYDF